MPKVRVLIEKMTAMLQLHSIRLKYIILARRPTMHMETYLFLVGATVTEPPLDG